MEISPYYEEKNLSFYCGKMEEVLPTFEANRFSTVITDPPYELNFMSRSWDRSGVAFRPETWAEVMRVCKPGAIMLCFGGTRTYHRMACAIEDAGWEIRDCIMWLYGCLSEDTEILVDGEWRPYTAATEGRNVLAFDPTENTYSWQPIERLFVYDYDDTAYRIHSDNTDQIVSRNHRCLVELESGKYGFQIAEEASRESEIHVPILEDVQDLLKSLPLHDSRTSGAEQDVRKEMRVTINPEPSREITSGQASRSDAHCVRSLQKTNVEGPRMDEEDRSANMLSPMQREAEGTGTDEAFPQRPCRLDRKVPPVLRREDDRTEEPSMEGRSNLLQEKGELRRSAVCPVSPGVSADGEEGLLHHGTSAGGGPSDGPMSQASRGGSPSQSRPVRQSSGESEPVCEQQGAQVVRGERHTASDLARIEPIRYHGVVWCVRVPTGAFVARRNGKVFVTGNSGFPKSLDISKSIDKSLGAEREVIGEMAYSAPDIRGNSSNGRGISSQSSKEAERLGVSITLPASEEARLWSGWGSSLKPAFEPVLLAMKPLDGTYAQNAIKHGVAGLNIDGARIPLNGDYKCGANGRPSQTGLGDNYDPAKANKHSPVGRWPANLIFDEAAAELLDRQSGITTSGAMKREVGEYDGESNVTFLRGRSGPQNQHGGTGGASRFFYCAKANKSDRGEGNTHPCVKPQSLLKYLCALTATPTGGEILDPFAGSMSTLLAAREMGRPIVGIEMNEEYCEIGKRRLSKDKSLF